MSKMLGPGYHDDAGHFGGMYVPPGPWEVVEVDPDNITPPFWIRRVYWIFDTKPDAIRGKHAHRDLDQLCMCVRGACTFVLDNGKSREEIRLEGTAKALRIRNWVWREMKDFTEDCVLTVLADKPYSPDDYIFDYDEFLAALGQKEADDKAAFDKRASQLVEDTRFATTHLRKLGVRP